MSGSSGVIPVTTATAFRLMYPAFADSIEYTDVQIGFWIQLASNLLDPIRWGDLLILGASLLTAHNLTLSKRDQLAVVNGGAPGGSGIPSGKTVGRVAVVLDTQDTSVKDAGPFNLTTYGTQFIYYAKLVGAGGVQVTGPMIFPGFPGAVIGVY